MYANPRSTDEGTVSGQRDQRHGQGHRACSCGDQDMPLGPWLLGPRKSRGSSCYCSPEGLRAEGGRQSAWVVFCLMPVPESHPPSAWNLASLQ